MSVNEYLLIFVVLEYNTPFEIFNIGIGKATSTNQLIDLCEEISGRKANITNVEVGQETIEEK